VKSIRLLWTSVETRNAYKNLVQKSLEKRRLGTWKKLRVISRWITRKEIMTKAGG
jgi:hypothetical protein